MRLTTKGRYAVTAMLDLALHGQSAREPGRYLRATGYILVLPGAAIRQVAPQ